jgi:hypothetical protein
MIDFDLQLKEYKKDLSGYYKLSLDIEHYIKDEKK